jgi:hypothetical protein
VQGVRERVNTPAMNFDFPCHRYADARLLKPATRS